MTNAFSNIATDLDLKAALRGGSTSNDMLPPRPDDKVSGEVGNRFTESLARIIAQGMFEPDPAHFVYVPKPGNTTRPAAILTLSDRVVYEALASLFRPRAEKALIGTDILFWPRAFSSNKRWPDFENAPLDDGAVYIVRADISGFYESIDHERLTNTLIEVTGRRPAAEALERFLGIVMGQRRGLPQGIETSDLFATSFLVRVDAAMISAGFSYWRHGDDVRVSAADYSEARESLFVLEKLLRAEGLVLNGAKSTILRRETYEEGCHDKAALWESVERDAAQSKAAVIVEDNDALEAALNKAGFDGDQILWDLHYHNRISVEEVIDKLSLHLQPNDYDIAEAVFVRAMERAPGSGSPLDKEVFHQQVSSALLRLSAGKRPAALPHMLSMLATYPDKSEILCSYLQSLADTHSDEVCSVCSDFLLAETFSTAWQKVHVLRVLALTTSNINAETVDRLIGFASEEDGDWLVRAESARVLAMIDSLDQRLARRLLNICPSVFKADIVFAIVNAGKETNDSWAPRLLEGQSLDPVMRVVVEKAHS